jgi:hypothetical protein
LKEAEITLRFDNIKENYPGFYIIGKKSSMYFYEYLFYISNIMPYIDFCMLIFVGKEGGAEYQTQDLVHARQLFSHGAIYPVPVS